MSKIQQKQIQRRNEIISKVMKLTEKTPFVELSIRDICEGTGISVGSFYHYFKEKSDLVCGLMELIDDYMEQEVLPLLTNESAFEDLRVISRGFAQHILNSGLEQAKLISICKPTDADEFGVRRPTFRMIESAVARGQERGEFRTDLSPVKITELILTAISGAAIDWSRREAGYNLLERMDEFVTFFFRALLK
jgi:AcrR family transcriptional regulator